MTGAEAAELAGRALGFVETGQVVGLGSGRAAASFVRALGGAVREGLSVRGVSTSESTAALAREVGIPLVPMEDAGAIDVTFDGADEVDPRLDLIKGYGGALVREKVVAAASGRVVILVGAEKLVPALGSRGKLPVEVVPFAAAFCRRRLAEMGHPAGLRTTNGAPFVTDNGNLILDCAVSAIADPPRLDATLRSMPGVVGTGLFLGMAHTVLVWDGGTVTTRSRPGA